MEEKRRTVGKDELVKLSKFLSLVLRHKPETIGLTLDAQGWASVPELLSKAEARGRKLSLEKLKEIVKENDKQRFGFNGDFSKIRARQGHSLAVDLQLVPREPPTILYHGTVDKNLASIKENGLTRQSRQHVHLSADKATALAVGSRYGKPVVLEIKAKEMHKEDHSFYLSENSVWLTGRVPSQYILFPDEKA